jgi:hypothetical protein
LLDLPRGQAVLDVEESGRRMVTGEAAGSDARRRGGVLDDHVDDGRVTRDGEDLLHRAEGRDALGGLLEAVGDARGAWGGRDVLEVVCVAGGEDSKTRGEGKGEVRKKGKGQYREKRAEGGVHIKGKIQD